MRLHKTMNCFQLVKTVLDELYSQINAIHRDNTDSVIKRKLEYLSQAYAKLSDGIEVDYGDPITRFAYIYKYTTSHANIVFDAIKDSENLKEVFNREVVDISCIGGGPGSDFLGILKFIDSGAAPNFKKLKCYLCDKEKNWRESWADVDDKLGVSNPFSIVTTYWELDVTDVSELPPQSKIFNVDLFTMVYFISELFSSREDTREFFETMFDHAKPGALFLFVDNYAQRFYGWFDEIAKACNLECIEESQGHYQTGADEEKSDLGIYYDKFGPVKLGADIAYRLYRK